MAAPTGRRRGNSTASTASSSAAARSASLTLPHRSHAGSISSSILPAIVPQSSHVTDPFLQAFLQPGFDPASYWNSTLGGGTGRVIPATTTTPTARSSSSPSSGASTADLAAQAQTTLSQLNAHTARLSSTLTQLTDDILRSGSRLAYEVELLRGETIGLAEVLAAQAAAAQASEGDSLADQPTVKGVPTITAADTAEASKANGETAAANGTTAAKSSSTSADEPPALAQLRMLAQVRERLDSVIKTFGDAMEFVMPPSALSVTASFLSVSGPGEGGAAGGDSKSSGSGDGNETSMEDRGQKVLKMRRDEVARLLASATTSDLSGLEAAADKVAELGELCRMWQGTSEEKARTRFVESLQRMVEDRQRQLEREGEREREKAERERQEQMRREQQRQSQQQGQQQGQRRTDGGSNKDESSQDASGSSSSNRGYAAGYGFISQLQKIRGGL